MTILIGRNASKTGEVLIAHNEDAPARFTMQTHLVRKLRRHPQTKITFEPNLSELELNDTRINLFWSEAKTFSDNYSDSAFCDLYVNGHGVVICSNNCAFSREDNPELLNGGIGYGLRRLVAEKAHSAKDALNIACDLIEKYGYASSGRSYAFADKDEIFVMQIVNGKHYAIQRVPDDEAAVIPNHYTIHDPDKKARGYQELVDYAQKRGWYNPENVFDFAKVYQSEDSYGLDKNTYRHIKAFEILLNMDLSELKGKNWQGLPFSIKPAKKVDIQTLKTILRSHTDNPHFHKPLTICNTETLESTIIQIRHDTDRTIIRKALGRPSYSPYLVWYFGIFFDPEGFEDIEPDKALDEHFLTKPEDMDWRNNAWYRAMAVNAVGDLLYDEKYHEISSMIDDFENQQEQELSSLDKQIELSLRNKPDIARAIMEGAVMKWAGGIDILRKKMRENLGIIVCEPLNSVNESGNFRVKIHDNNINLDDLDLNKCICGPSYCEYDKWSRCSEINAGENYIEFMNGEWVDEAVPCFTDLYILLVDKSGKKSAGTVKIQVRR